MKIFAVILNVLMWAFFCMVMVTDGPPESSGILLALGTFLMPILNVLVIRVLASPGRSLMLTALILNILWLGAAGWRIMTQYPSHPEEEGLIEYVSIMALTPIVSALALYLGLRSTEPVEVE